MYDRGVDLIENGIPGVVSLIFKNLKSLVLPLFMEVHLCQMDHIKALDRRELRHDFV